MSDKVSPIAVMKEAIGVIKTNGRAFGLFMFASILMEFAIIWWQSIPEDYAWVGLAVMVPLAVYYYPSLLQRIIHHTISFLRGKDEMKGKFWMFLMGIIAIKIVSGLLGAFASFLSVFIFGALAAAILGQLVMLFAMLRYGFVLPAIAVADQYDYTLAWKMSKGHTFRIFATFLPYMAVVVPLGLKMATPPSDWGLHLLAPVNAALLVASGIITVVTLAIYTVWYVRLRERYDAAGATSQPVGDGDPLAEDSGEALS